MRLQTETYETTQTEAAAYNGAALQPARSRSLWPDAVAYQEALQNPHAALQNAGLGNGRVSVNRLGLPLAYTGRFAAVFRVKDNEGHGQSWAVRCFTSEGEGARRAVRYGAISNHLEAAPEAVRTRFVPFRYQETGIHVGGTDYPLLVMTWAQGKPLGKWAEAHHGDADALRRLCQSLARLVVDLEGAEISHGDFQHDNLLISPTGRRATLVDYDGVWVPALSGLPPSERGHPNYQHPARDTADFGPRGDRFSLLVLQTALFALSCDPTLWETFGEKSDDALLFSHDDFTDTNASPVFSVLRLVSAGDPTLARLLSALEAACKNHAEPVPLFAPEAFGPVETEAELNIAEPLRVSAPVSASAPTRAAPSPSFLTSVAADSSQKWWIQNSKKARERRKRANRIHRSVFWAATIINALYFGYAGMAVAFQNASALAVFYGIWIQAIIFAVGFYSWPDNFFSTFPSGELRELESRAKEKDSAIFHIERHLTTLNANAANSSIVAFTQNRLQNILLTSIAAEVGLGLRELSPLSRAGVTHLSNTTQMPDTISGAIQAKLQLARRKAVNEARADFDLLCKTRRDMLHELEALRNERAGLTALCDELKGKSVGTGGVAFWRFLTHLLSW